mmetsp:Transcript_17190/g.21734  ORF Transcript_17190/g.21734 Transcript_17190/m.21734 type:complete len:81 (+) Transcript_17190:47-289(+)
MMTTAKKQEIPMTCIVFSYTCVVQEQVHYTAVATAGCHHHSHDFDFVVDFVVDFDVDDDVVDDDVDDDGYVNFTGVCKLN